MSRTLSVYDATVCHVINYVCVCREEWSMDLGSVDAHELDPSDLQVFLQSYRMICVSSEKVAGQQQWLFVAEQVLYCVG